MPQVDENGGIPRSIPTGRALAIAASLVSGAFGAGISYQLAKDAARAEIAAKVAPAAQAAAAAQAEAFHLKQELRDLRRDLARGIGRCLASPPTPSARDYAGKTAQAMYDREIGEGMPPNVALQHTMDSDL